MCESSVRSSLSRGPRLNVFTNSDVWGGGVGVCVFGNAFEHVVLRTVSAMLYFFPVNSS